MSNSEMSTSPEPVHRAEFHQFRNEIRCDLREIRDLVRDGNSVASNALTSNKVLEERVANMKDSKARYGAGAAGLSALGSFLWQLFHSSGGLPPSVGK